MGILRLAFAFLRRYNLKRGMKILIGSLGCIVLLLLLGTAFYLMKNKILTPAMIQAQKYPVRGVDVSRYQGEIDWDILSTQDIEFAFIKATEGSSHVDNKFIYNMEQAYESGLCVGAYHFFSFDSPGETQAAHYIRTVGSLYDKMPPIIDFEFYGDKDKNPPEPEETRRQLQTLLNILEEEYKEKPIIYATGTTYKMYLEGYLKEYPIWIRNVYYETALENGREWTFWQYKDNALLEGYSGDEEKIDLNVFRGSREELAAMKVQVVGKSSL